MSIPTESEIKQEVAMFESEIIFQTLDKEIARRKDNHNPNEWFIESLQIVRDKYYKKACDEELDACDLLSDKGFTIVEK